MSPTLGTEEGGSIPSMVGEVLHHSDFILSMQHSDAMGNRPGSPSVSNRGCSADDLATCLSVLSRIAAGDESVEQPEVLQRAIARAARRNRKQNRKDASIPANDERQDLGQNPGRLKSTGRRCYGCRTRLAGDRPATDWFCTLCAAINEQQKNRDIDLSGYTVIVTGGRIKIGHAAARRCLRHGATVHVTTRFRDDAQKRFEEANDYAHWRDRLHLHEMDFRNLPHTAEQIEWFHDNLDCLDILIHNAAQTVRDEAVNLSPIAGLFPVSPSDNQLLSQQPELALVESQRSNSWSLTIDQVHPIEMLETWLVNANTPFLFNRRLRRLLSRSPRGTGHIVHVTGADGRFSPNKTIRHPHVNMSKAALNMMTRTTAADYASDRIWVNSVDTGWVTHEGPPEVRDRMFREGFRTPLDCEDAAARIIAPIADAIEGRIVYGCLFRHFQPSDW